MDSSVLEREKELKLLNDSLNERCAASLQPPKKQLAAKANPKKAGARGSALISDESRKAANATDKGTASEAEGCKAKRMIPDNLVRRNVSTEGIIRFLKAKVCILQQELDISHKEISKRAGESAEKAESVRKMESRQAKFEQEVGALKDQVNKLIEQKNCSDTKLKESQQLCGSLQKEADLAKEKVRAAKEESRALEARLFKCQEDLECVRQNYHTLKTTSKHTENELQRDIKCYENQIKFCKKQRDDLIAAYKKQLLLIDNLKRQNACLEQTNLLRETKEEFKQCLDWNQNKK